jgi:hypothetical protein
VTSATSKRGKGNFSKITFLKSVHCNEKDELCPVFEVNIFTKSLHRGGVNGMSNDDSSIKTIDQSHGD